MGERETESSQELIQFLEQLSGRQLRTREDVRRFLKETEAKREGADRTARIWQTVKQGTWLLLLALAFLQYYFLGVLIDINSMPQIRFTGQGTTVQSERLPRT